LQLVGVVDRGHVLEGLGFVVSGFGFQGPHGGLQRLHLSQIMGVFGDQIGAT